MTIVDAGWRHRVQVQGPHARFAKATRATRYKKRVNPSRQLDNGRNRHLPSQKGAFQCRAQGAARPVIHKAGALGSVNGGEDREMKDEGERRLGSVLAREL